MNLDCRQTSFALQLTGAILTTAALIIPGGDRSPSPSEGRREEPPAATVRQHGENEMVLRHVLYTKIKGLDPANMRDVYSVIVGSQIFETLYQYHFLKRPYQLEPLLAEQMPKSATINSRIP